MLLAIVPGLLGAAFRLSPVRWLAWCGDLYATVVRGIPRPGADPADLHGGQGSLNWVAPQLGYDDYIDLNPSCPASAPSVLSSAPISRDLPRRLMAIPKGQGRGRLRLMSHRQVFFPSRCRR